jgi:single-stranded DNA-binding protein
MFGNDITVIGSVSQEPKLLENAYGASAKFAVAHNAPPTKDGNKGAVTYFDVMVNGAQAEHVIESIKKGMRVMISGRITTYKGRDGITRFSLAASVVAVTLEFNEVVAIKPAESDDDDVEDEDVAPRRKSRAAKPVEVDDDDDGEDDVPVATTTRKRTTQARKTTRVVEVDEDEDDGDGF